MDNQNWFVHVNIKRGESGEMHLFKRPMEAYIVPVDEDEVNSYHKLRIAPESVGVS
jgi:hypothetical protein